MAQVVAGPPQCVEAGSAVQCGNYDEPEKRACEAERTVLDRGPAIDRIARTARLLDP